jgi:small subunit ribosomal protein S2
MITKREFLFESGVQYGHRTSRLNPKMNTFIWGKRNGIHLINIALTEIQLSKAEAFLEGIAERGKQILWVGTKKIVRDIVRKHAEKTKSPYLAERWIGGTLTNYNEVKKSIKNLSQNKEVYEKSSGILTKKELSILKKKIDRAQKCVGGIESLSWPVGAIVVADAKKDRIAIEEAINVGVPVISIVDTNSSPDGISVCIPANDDLKKSVDVIFNYLSDAVLRGAERYKPEVDVSVLEEKVGFKEKKFKKKSVVVEKKIEDSGVNTKFDLGASKVESINVVESSKLESGKVIEEKSVEKDEKVKFNDISKSTVKVKAASKVKSNTKTSSVSSKSSAKNSTVKKVASKKKGFIKDDESVEVKKPTKTVKKKTSSIKSSTKSVVAKSAFSAVKKTKKVVRAKKK